MGCLASAVATASKLDAIVAAVFSGHSWPWSVPE
jgi:hypothetical protein